MTPDIEFRIVHCKLFITLRSMLVASLLSAARVTAAEAVVESKSSDDIGIFESNTEAIIAFVAVAGVLVLSQLHNLMGFRKKRIDKLGYVVESQEHIGEPQLPELTAAEAPNAKRSSEDEHKAYKKRKKAKYIDMLVQHAKALRVYELEITLEKMENRCGPLLLRDYMLAIPAFRKAGELTKAHTWMRRAIDQGHVPGLCSFNAMVSAYVKQGNLEQALDVAFEMKRLGVELDGITYSTIIDGWARHSDPITCQLWMGKMMASGLKPTGATFASVMRACAYSGLSAEVEQWYELSQKLHVELSLVGYGSVSKAYAKNDDLVNAMKWLTRCVENGVQPNAQCFMGVLKSILRKGDFDLAANVIERMQAADVEPDDEIFSTCIVAATKVGQRQRAQKWADECVARNLVLTTAAQAALAQAKLRIPGSNSPQAAPADSEQGPVEETDENTVQQETDCE